MPFGFVDSFEPQQQQQHHPVQSPYPELAFQLPSYLYSSTPALASGGGAEVISLTGEFNDARWQATHGFTEKHEGKQPAVDVSFDFDAFMTTPVALTDPVFPLFQEAGGQRSAMDVVEGQQAGEPLEPLRLQPLHQELISQQQQVQRPLLPPPPPPPTLNLPVLYSATGFDVLTILSRVYNRPHPRIQLGPVDFTCSFVVVDVRQTDHPIIYCSPNFCKLTGYPEREVVGRNCRFLQAPGGVMEKGGERPDEAAGAAAAYLRRRLERDRECQVVITNYRKDGTGFCNLLTVIPILEEEGEVVYHVGFQIDFVEQPKAIMRNLSAGRYHYLERDDAPKAGVSSLFRDRRSSSSSLASSATLVVPPVLVSKEMKRLLANPSFLRSIRITTNANAMPPLTLSLVDNHNDHNTNNKNNDHHALASIYNNNHPLHMMLLEVGPDFTHVLSLKGSFLYVGPSVRRVLGYEPQELVGASIADLAHPEDVVPVMRELKESSSNGGAGGYDGVSQQQQQQQQAASSSSSTLTPSSSALIMQGQGQHQQGQQGQPRTVDLVFRAKAKNGVYVWVESRGRLHVEPGKGKKAIILTGRAREMGNITWETVARGGGLAEVRAVERRGGGGAGGAVGITAEMEVVVVRQEFWGTMNAASMVLLVVGSGIRDVLGWAPEDFQGASIGSLLSEPSALEAQIQRLAGPTEGGSDASAANLVTSTCRMRMKDGGSAVVVVNVFRNARDPAVRGVGGGGIAPAHLLYQVRLASAETYSLYPSSATVVANTNIATGSNTAHPSAVAAAAAAAAMALPALSANVFDALDIRRGSSWQYELQQLKFGNRKLVEEIVRLEAVLRRAKAKKGGAGGDSMSGGGSGSQPSSSSSLYVQQNQQRQQQQHQQYPRYNNQQQHYPHQQQHQHQHQHQHHRYSESPRAPFEFLHHPSPLPTAAALPLRVVPGTMGAQQQQHQQQQQQQRYPLPPPLLSSFVSQRTYAIAPPPPNDYLGPNPFVRRLQEDVAAQAQASAGTGGYFSSSGVGVKRSWGVMEGRER